MNSVSQKVATSTFCIHLKPRVECGNSACRAKLYETVAEAKKVATPGPLHAPNTAHDVMTAELVTSWPADLTDAIALRAGRCMNQGHIAAASAIAAQVAATYYGPLAAEAPALRDALHGLTRWLERHGEAGGEVPPDEMIAEAKAVLARLDGAA